MGYISNRNFQEFEGLSALQEMKLAYLSDGSSTQMLTLSSTGIVGVQAIPSGGGGGGVSSFSAGNLSPLFTTTEDDPTTNPVLNFILSNAAANTYFGNSTGSSAAPSYIAAGALTKVDDPNVTLSLSANAATSLLRSVTITVGWSGQLPISRGGTGQSTASAAFNALAPSQTGNSGKFLTTNGSTPSWANLPQVAPVVVTSGATTLTLDSTTSYIKSYVFTGSVNTTWTMPAIGTTGELIMIKNRGTANILLQRAGSDQLFDKVALNSISILPGDTFTLQDDGTFWILM